MLSSAALRPTSGSAPAPNPLVTFSPICIFWFAWDRYSACLSVFTEMNSTPRMPYCIIRLTALLPAPPTPTTLSCARLPLSISSSRPIGISFPPDNLSYVTKQFSDLFDESALAYHSYQPVHAVFFLSMHHEIHYRKSAGVIWGGKSGHPRHSYL